jgi:hypothetical protein
MTTIPETITDTDPNSPTFGEKVVIQHPASPAIPVTYDSADWQEFAYGVLGTVALPAGTTEQKMLAGITRYGEILLAGRASVNPATVAAFEQYNRATNFRKDKVQVFLGILNRDSKIVTNAEFAAIIAARPNA